MITKEEKLKKIIDYVEKNNISAYSIAQNTKLTEAGIGKILNKSSKNPRDLTVDSIFSYLFPIKKTENIVKEPDAIWVNYERFKMVPLVGYRARDGFLSGWGDEEYLEELPKIAWDVDKEYKGHYVVFEVSGDSMESSDPRECIFEGDLLLSREVQRHHWKNGLHINKWEFIIVHKIEGILVKKITNQNLDTGEITLHSYNDYYEDQKVYLDDIVAIFNVVDLRRSRKL